MNILVDNFLSYSSSQCLYLYHALKALDKKEVKTFYWPSREISTYDIFDDTKPDIFISHTGSMDYELGVYLEDNSKVAEDLIIILSTFGGKADEAYLEQMDKALQSKRLKNLFLLTEANLNTKRIKTIKTYNCVDDNIKPRKLKYNIPVAYFVNKQEHVTGEDAGSYHYISNTIDGVDIRLEEIKLAQLFNNYDKIIFKNLTSFNQSFFDAAYHCKEVYYTSQNEEMDNISKSLFGQVLNINNEEVDFKKVKDRIEQKHMPYNRVKSLMSQLPINHNLFSKG